MTAGLLRLNALPAAAAVAELLRACGSRRWAERLAARRPFQGEAGLFAAAEAVFDGLDREDWLEAFRAHPRIGDRAALRARFPTTGAWSEEEQAGAAAAGEEVLAAIEEAQRSYEVRFGHLFIVCASGKSAPEMLALLRARLQDSPGAELAVAAAEQRKITRLRLERILAS